MTKKDIKKVYDKMEEKSNLADFKAFKDDIQPLVDGSTRKLHNFIKEHAQMKEMIRRFDEVISEKVNKFALLEL